jgi:hypothetical protein
MYHAATFNDEHPLIAGKSILVAPAQPATPSDWPRIDREFSVPVQRGVDVAEPDRDRPHDFSAFYMGGKIVASGNGGNLYDLATQARVEGAYTVRSDSASFLPYNHAPFEAVLLAPLAVFPYSTACWIWWVCNLLLGYLVLFLLRPQPSTP